MEVMVQSATGSPSGMDNLDLNGTMISPYYLSAPSSPKRFGEYYSEFYHDEFEYFSSSTLNFARNPSNPFEAPINSMDDSGDDGFAFHVSRESETPSRSAEELFDGGKIKPLKLEVEGNETFNSNKSTQLFSSNKKNECDSSDPFVENRRGRERLSSSNSGRRVSRSHSPYRVSRYAFEDQQQPQPRSNKDTESMSITTSPDSSITSSSTTKGSSKRWRLKDFLMFRSASEGRGTSKDPFKKYYKKVEQVNASSFRSSDSLAPRFRRKPISAHELHYNMKKAESEDMKRRTYLPYKRGILGLAGFGL